MTDPSSLVSWDAVERWLAGKSPADEAERVQTVFTAHPEAAALVQHYRDVLSEGAPAFTSDDLKVVIANVQARVQENVGAQRFGEGVGKAKKEQPNNLWRYQSVGFTDPKKGGGSMQPLRRWAPALAVAVVMLITIFIGRYPRPDIGTSRTYTTAIGQRASLVLDDGTRVMMAPQTTLRLVRFGQQSRKLVLEGDAYFEVEPSARAPFVVETGTSSVRVLGTAFEVQHYRDDHETRIAVATGKVFVSSGPRRRDVLVTAKQVLSVTDSTQTVRSVDDMDTEIGWLGDRLIFRGVPMARVLETLTRWYGYEFRYTDPGMERQLVTIGLSMHSSTEALATLEQILDVNLTVVGNTVTLTPRHSRSIPGLRVKRYDVWLPSREVGR